MQIKCFSTNSFFLTLFVVGMVWVLIVIYTILKKKYITTLQSLNNIFHKVKYLKLLFIQIKA